MADELEVQPGQTVCVVGRGTNTIVHAHYTVKRKTKTLFTATRMVQDREVERRFRYSGREVGAPEYGGLTAKVNCQRPRKEEG